MAHYHAFKALITATKRLRATNNETLEDEAGTSSCIGLSDFYLGDMETDRRTLGAHEVM